MRVHYGPRILDLGATFEAFKRVADAFLSAKDAFPYPICCRKNGRVRLSARSALGLS